eukprot:GHRR01014471.1.p1 GENE.GHRR01014471.1~~GHRR01014471.1.p1  ORF type:complete len:716 (+),score=228.03 GHRR01014471.1:397-2544(+)
MPLKSTQYYRLDVETAADDADQSFSLQSPAGFKTIQQFELERDEAAKHSTRRRLLWFWGIVGSISVLLVLLAALTTNIFNLSDSYKSSPATPAPASLAASPAVDHVHAAGLPVPGVWNESAALQFEDLINPTDDFQPCEGPALQCELVNKLPLPMVDFRNLSRRATATQGMVAADSSRCSEMGRDILAADGNAADAAVTVALCLGVVNPISSGLGGGAFIMVRAANGTAQFIDAREAAPAAANATMYAGLPSNASLDGALAVAVPGELSGLAELHSKFGSKPWADLVKPAANLARLGFAAHPYLVYVMSGPFNAKRLQADVALREAFFIKGSNGRWRLPRVGELCCKRPKLADTLDTIAEKGPGYLSSPSIAAAMAAELSAAGGIISPLDLETAAPAIREPLRVELGELELLVPPPPSSAVVVAFALKFLAGYGNRLQNSSSSDGDNSHSDKSSVAGLPAGRRLLQAGQAARVTRNPVPSFGVNPGRDGGLGMQRLVEAMKHGFAIRTALGDPGPSKKPFEHASAINAAVADLLSDTFVDKLRMQTLDDGVLPDEQYGGRWNPKGVAPPEEHGTSHFCVVDRERNAVSITTSVNTVFGSGVVSESTGILWGNTMDDFAQPNKSSFVTPHPSEANFIAPGKRPLSAMSPIIVTHKPSGRLVAVAGGSGGPLIVSATLQTLARLLLEGADVSDAVMAPRVHDQLLPSNITFYESYTW